VNQRNSDAGEKMKFRSSKISSTLMVSVLFLLLPALSFVMLTGSVHAEGELGSLNAWIVGIVDNAEDGMLVSCKTVYTGGSVPKDEYFNGTTNASGHFNITVDSNDWDERHVYSPYQVSIFSTYYKNVISGKDLYTFQGHTYAGNETTVPPGSLSVSDAPTSNLTIKILNRTSSMPLEGVEVEISYTQVSIPEPPFVTIATTDITGEVVYPRVRSVNTTIDAKKDNFRFLNNTEEHNYVIVQGGGNTQITFDLIEKPWPFTVLIDRIDVNHSDPITIDFNRVMDPATITDASNFRLWKIEGDVDVPFTITPKSGDQIVDLIPDEPLEYNTNYSLRLDTRLKDEGGSKPLWRAMTVTFTTESPPGIVIGRIIDSVSSDPVEGIVLRIFDQMVISQADGNFIFPLIPKGSYRMIIDESYLYNSSSIGGLNVEKGDTLDLGDIPIDPKPSGSLRVKVLSDGVPLEGAWVRVIDDLIKEGDFNVTTNSTGIALFPRVLANAITIEAGAPHHNTKGDMVFVNIGSEGYVEINLIEDPIPVWIEPLETNLDGTVVPTTDFLVHLSEAITFSTLNVTLWSTGSGETLLEKIPLTPPEKGSDDLTYIIDPMITLPLETSYIMMVSDGLLTLNDSLPLLWRNFEYKFNTPDHPMININGTLLFEGKIFEDYTVSFGKFSAAVGSDGNFNITIDPESEVETDFFIINGSHYGYASYENEFTLPAGTIMQVGTINLLHVPGWYTPNPADGSENIEPDVVITLTFMESVMTPKPDLMDRIISIIPDGSNAPIAGSYSYSNENKTIAFTPSNDLEANTLYSIRISKELMRWDNVTMFPLGNVTIFKIKPPSIIVSLVEPEDISSIPIDGFIRINFNYRVNKEAVELSLSLEPDIEGMNVYWTSSSEFILSGYMTPNTGYSMILPAGVYGLEEEPILVDFELSFTTGEGYGVEHLIGTPQIFPSIDTGWDPGENIRISGIVEDSEGYIVTAVLILDNDEVLSVTDVVASDGSWGINISAPNKEGSYTLKVTISMPGGPNSDELEYTVNVGEVKENGDASDDSWIIIVIVIIAVVLLAILIGAFLYTKKQKALAEKELSRVEYTDVEGEWEDPEE
jgi:hypothetical protein